MMSACACTKRGSHGGLDSGGENEGNIPSAEAGGPLKDVSFAFDSSTLSESAKSTLRSNVQWLSDNASSNVTVEGHCDERGTNEYNMALGERRAKSVEDFYRSLGVTSSRVSRVSYGEEMPVDMGHDESAWSKNRRAHSRVN
ncbi:MAG: peptidoglycan-associated lipoprotein Pal [Deltaproteobacteria bacterium]|nr:peptidoglycan-associated lipoprotein Pal [Deltaproteobacteria bacterium]